MSAFVCGGINDWHAGKHGSNVTLSSKWQDDGTLVLFSLLFHTCTNKIHAETITSGLQLKVCKFTFIIIDFCFCFLNRGQKGSNACKWNTGMINDIVSTSILSNNSIFLNSIPRQYFPPSLTITTFFLLLKSETVIFNCLGMFIDSDLILPEEFSLAATDRDYSPVDVKGLFWGRNLMSLLFVQLFLIGFCVFTTTHNEMLVDRSHKMALRRSGRNN